MGRNEVAGKVELDLRKPVAGGGGGDGEGGRRGAGYSVCARLLWTGDG